MNRHFAEDSTFFARLPDVHSRSSQSKHSAAKSAIMLPTGPALTVILLLSLGLWGAIWVATSSLFSL